MNGAARKLRAARVRDTGGSVVVMVAAVPLLIVLMCVVVDLGRYAYFHMSLQEAAYAASADLTQNVSMRDEDAQESALASAYRAAPGLASSGTTLSCTVRAGAWQEKTFSSYRYTSSSSGFKAVETTLLKRDVQVSFTLTGVCVTAVGKWILASSESAGAFELQASAVAVQSKLQGAS